MPAFALTTEGVPTPENGLVSVLLCGAAWVGHAYWLTTLLNILYGLPLPKPLLRLWRLATGCLILGFPVVAGLVASQWPALAGWSAIRFYSLLCLALGAGVYPGITFYRLLRPRPRAWRAERTETVDLLAELGDKVIGEGRMSGFVRRLPRWGQRHLFRVDWTDLSVSCPALPPEWDGLSIVLLSDFHFHGTPSRAFFEAIVKRLTDLPTPDLVVLAGDFLDSDAHRPWIREILGHLRWNEHGLAVLGNHDLFHDPTATRAALQEAGFTVCGGIVQSLSIRGQACIISGHEGPWIGPVPQGEGTHRQSGPFHLCVSHSPDNFYWGVRQGVNLMLCGHVHGGQIRLPIIGSMFVPSIFGRRFDMGVFEKAQTLMVVGRGLGGKEPLRFRCNPQVIRLQLHAALPG
ncbi:MAG: metallophosphoesterase [Bacteroidales bacterium]|nr:metallophosphoesterase [Bacteroidales bacterium]